MKKIRFNYAEEKVDEIDKISRKDLLTKKEIIKSNSSYILNKNIKIDDNLFLAQNKRLMIKKGVNIFFEKDFSILSEGSIIFDGTKEEPIIVFSDDKVGSLILSNNKFKLKNVIFKNLSYQKIKKKFYMGV